MKDDLKPLHKYLGGKFFRKEKYNLKGNLIRKPFGFLIKIIKQGGNIGVRESRSRCRHA
jgi:hypothetical protein